MESKSSGIKTPSPVKIESLPKNDNGQDCLDSSKSPKKPIILGVVQSSVGGKSNMGNIIRKRRWDQPPEEEEKSQINNVKIEKVSNNNPVNSAKIEDVKLESKPDIKDLINKFEIISDNAKKQSQNKECVKKLPNIADDPTTSYLVIPETTPVKSTRVKLVRPKLNVQIKSGDKIVDNVQKIISDNILDSNTSLKVQNDKPTESTPPVKSKKHKEIEVPHLVESPQLKSTALMMISSYDDSPSEDSLSEIDSEVVKENLIDELVNVDDNLSIENQEVKNISEKECRNRDERAWDELEEISSDRKEGTVLLDESKCVDSKHVGSIEEEMEKMFEEVGTSTECQYLEPVYKEKVLDKEDSLNVFSSMHESLDDKSKNLNMITKSWTKTIDEFTSDDDSKNKSIDDNFSLKESKTEFNKVEHSVPEKLFIEPNIVNTKEPDIKLIERKGLNNLNESDKKMGDCSVDKSKVILKQADKVISLPVQIQEEVTDLELVQIAPKLKSEATIFDISNKKNKSIEVFTDDKINLDEKAADDLEIQEESNKIHDFNTDQTLLLGKKENERKEIVDDVSKDDVVIIVKNIQTTDEYLENVKDLNKKVISNLNEEVVEMTKWDNTVGIKSKKQMKSSSINNMELNVKDSLDPEGDLDVVKKLENVKPDKEIIQTSLEEIDKTEKVNSDITINLSDTHNTDVKQNDLEKVIIETKSNLKIDKFKTITDETNEDLNELKNVKNIDNLLKRSISLDTVKDQSNIDIKKLDVYISNYNEPSDINIEFDSISDAQTIHTTEIHTDVEINQSNFSMEQPVVQYDAKEFGECPVTTADSDTLSTALAKIEEEKLVEDTSEVIRICNVDSMAEKKDIPMCTELYVESVIDQNMKQDKLEEVCQEMSIVIPDNEEKTCVLGDGNVTVDKSNIINEIGVFNIDKSESDIIKDNEIVNVKTKMNLEKTSVVEREVCEMQEIAVGLEVQSATDTCEENVQLQELIKINDVGKENEVYAILNVDQHSETVELDITENNVISVSDIVLGEVSMNSKLIQSNEVVQTAGSVEENMQVNVTESENREELNVINAEFSDKPHPVCDKEKNIDDDNSAVVVHVEDDGNKLDVNMKESDLKITSKVGYREESSNKSIAVVNEVRDGGICSNDSQILGGDIAQGDEFEIVRLIESEVDLEVQEDSFEDKPSPVDVTFENTSENNTVILKLNDDSEEGNKEQIDLHLGQKRVESTNEKAKYESDNSQENILNIIVTSVETENLIEFEGKNNEEINAEVDDKVDFKGKEMQPKNATEDIEEPKLTVTEEMKEALIENEEFKNVSPDSFVGIEDNENVKGINMESIVQHESEEINLFLTEDEIDIEEKEKENIKDDENEEIKLILTEEEIDFEDKEKQNNKGDENNEIQLFPTKVVTGTDNEQKSIKVDKKQEIKLTLTKDVFDIENKENDKDRHKQINLVPKEGVIYIEDVESDNEKQDEKDDEHEEIKIIPTDDVIDIDDNKEQKDKNKDNKFILTDDVLDSDDKENDNYEHKEISLVSGEDVIDIVDKGNDNEIQTDKETKNEEIELTLPEDVLVIEDNEMDNKNQNDKHEELKLILTDDVIDIKDDEKQYDNDNKNEEIKFTITNDVINAKDKENYNNKHEGNNLYLTEDVTDIYDDEKQTDKDDNCKEIKLILPKDVINIEVNEKQNDKDDKNDKIKLIITEDVIDFEDSKKQNDEDVEHKEIKLTQTQDVLNTGHKEFDNDEHEEVNLVLTEDVINIEDKENDNEIQINKDDKFEEMKLILSKDVINIQGSTKQNNKDDKNKEINKIPILDAMNIEIKEKDNSKGDELNLIPSEIVTGIEIIQNENIDKNEGNKLVPFKVLMDIEVKQKDNTEVNINQMHHQDGIIKDSYEIEGMQIESGSECNIDSKVEIESGNIDDDGSRLESKHITKSDLTANLKIAENTEDELQENSEEETQMSVKEITNFQRENLSKPSETCNVDLITKDSKTEEFRVDVTQLEEIIQVVEVDNGFVEGKKIELGMDIKNIEKKISVTKKVAEPPISHQNKSKFLNISEPSSSHILIKNDFIGNTVITKEDLLPKKSSTLEEVFKESPSTTKSDLKLLKTSPLDTLSENILLDNITSETGKEDVEITAHKLKGKSTEYPVSELEVHLLDDTSNNFVETAVNESLNTENNSLKEDMLINIEPVEVPSKFDLEVSHVKEIKTILSNNKSSEVKSTDIEKPELTLAENVDPNLELNTLVVDSEDEDDLLNSSIMEKSSSLNSLLEEELLEEKMEEILTSRTIPSKEEVLTTQNKGEQSVSETDLLNVAMQIEVIKDTLDNKIIKTDVVMGQDKRDTFEVDLQLSKDKHFSNDEDVIEKREVIENKKVEQESLQYGVKINIMEREIRKEELLVDIDKNVSKEEDAIIKEINTMEGKIVQEVEENLSSISKSNEMADLKRWKGRSNEVILIEEDKNIGKEEDTIVKDNESVSGKVTQTVGENFPSDLKTIERENSEGVITDVDKIIGHKEDTVVKKYESIEGILRQMGGENLPFDSKTNEGVRTDMDKTIEKKEDSVVKEDESVKGKGMQPAKKKLSNYKTSENEGEKMKEVVKVVDQNIRKKEYAVVKDDKSIEDKVIQTAEENLTFNLKTIENEKEGSEGIRTDVDKTIKKNEDSVVKEYISIEGKITQTSKENFPDNEGEKSERTTTVDKIVGKNEDIIVEQNELVKGKLSEIATENLSSNLKTNENKGEKSETIMTVGKIIEKKEDSVVEENKSMKGNVTKTAEENLTSDLKANENEGDKSEGVVSDVDKTIGKKEDIVVNEDKLTEGKIVQLAEDNLLSDLKQSENGEEKSEVTMSLDKIIQKKEDVIVKEDETVECKLTQTNKEPELVQKNLTTDLKIIEEKGKTKDKIVQKEEHPKSLFKRKNEKMNFDVSKKKLPELLLLGTGKKHNVGEVKEKPTVNESKEMKIMTRKKEEIQVSDSVTLTKINLDTDKRKEITCVKKPVNVIHEVQLLQTSSSKDDGKTVLKETIPLTVKERAQRISSENAGESVKSKLLQERGSTSMTETTISPVQKLEAEISSNVTVKRVPKRSFQKVEKQSMSSISTAEISKTSESNKNELSKRSKHEEDTNTSGEVGIEKSEEIEISSVVKKNELKKQFIQDVKQGKAIGNLPLKTKIILKKPEEYTSKITLESATTDTKTLHSTRDMLLKTCPEKYKGITIKPIVIPSEQGGSLSVKTDMKSPKHSPKSPLVITSPKRIEKELPQTKLEPITLKLSKDNPIIMRSPSLSPKKSSDSLKIQDSKEQSVSPQSKTLGYTLKIGKDSTQIIPKDTSGVPTGMKSSEYAKVEHLFKNTGLTITPVVPHEQQESQKLNKITLKLSKAGGHPEIKCEDKCDTWKTVNKLSAVDITPIGKTTISLTQSGTMLKRKDSIESLISEKKIKLNESLSPEYDAGPSSKLQGLLTKALPNKMSDPSTSSTLHIINVLSPKSTEAQTNLQTQVGLDVMKIEKPDVPVPRKRGRPRKVVATVVPGQFTPSTMRNDPNTGGSMFPVPLFNLSDPFMEADPQTLFPDQVQPSTGRPQRSCRGRIKLPIVRTRKPRGGGILKGGNFIILF